jgi:hypothetical protein
MLLIPFAKARFRNSLFNNGSKSALNQKLNFSHSIVRFHFHKIYSNSKKIMVKYSVFNLNAAVKLKNDRHTVPMLRNKTKIIMTRRVYRKS